MKVYTSILFFACWTSLSAQFFTNSRQQYGKSRIQYKQFEWKTINFQRFNLYFHPDEEKLVQYVDNAFLNEMHNMENFFNFRLDDHLDIVVYSSKSEFEASNIGLSEENQNITGISKTIGSKVCIYYENNHQEFNTQIKAAITEIMLKKMLFGGNWKDVIKANIFSVFPEWYINGFISYASQDWNATIERKVKDNFLIGRFDDFSALEGEEAKLLGHAFWHFIEVTYGKHLIPQIIFASRKTRNPSKGFEYILKKNINVLVDASATFYKTTYYNEITHQNEIQGEQLVINAKFERVFQNLSLSPDEQKIAYVENNHGRIRIVIQDLNSGFRNVIYRSHTNLNHSVKREFPILAWHPSGRKLTFFDFIKGELTLLNYTIPSGKISKNIFKGVTSVNAFDYNEDGTKILLSASLSGQTDLFIYHTDTKQLQQISNDLWDDVGAKFIQNDKKIAFFSNRPNDVVSVKNDETIIKQFDNDFDLFTLDIQQIEQDNIPLKRITNTPLANEKQVNEIDEKTLSILSDKNGLYNRYIIEIQENNYLTKPATNLVTSIIEDCYLPERKVFLSLIFQNYHYKILKNPLLNYNEVEINNTHYKQAQFLAAQQQLKTDKTSKTLKKSAPKKQNFEVLKTQINSHYTKQEVSLHITQQNEKSEHLAISNQTLKGNPYKTNFARDYLNLTFGNQFMNNAYQRYYGPGSIYQNPELSLLATIGFSDVFENIKMMGGFRVPFNFNAWEFLGKIQFLKFRFDHELTVYRRSYKTYDYTNAMLSKLITHTVNYTASYPFSNTLKLYGTASYRHDKRVFLALDNPSLDRPNEIAHQAGFTTALVFDNSHQIQENIWEGAKMKIFAKYINQFSPNKGMLNMGFDFRYSYKIVKNLIWVNRIAAATSLGQQKLVYLVGGVNNWMFRGKNYYNTDLTIDQSQNFAYQTLVTPMRGFVQNSRNGNSFFVWNTELRLPLFSFLFKHPVKSHFLRNFQLIAFGDLGTAWTGKSPFSATNDFNTQTFQDGAITIKLQNSSNPLIFGFGLGVRMKLFGYFTRFDFGWGVQSGTVSKLPKIQFSISHDI